jgi:UDP-N-acetylmuramoyl-tripeptide--D-alanyl-D-alanine ligase
MREIGPDAEALHRELGAEAARRLRGGLVGVGALGAEIVAGARAAGLEASRAVATDNPEEAARLVAGWTNAGDWVLVKASRGMRLERAVDALKAALDGPGNPET